MSNRFDIELNENAWRELEKLMQEVGPKLAKKGLKKALRESAKPIIKDARGKVPTRSKALKKSLGQKVRTNNRRGVGYSIVGARSKWTTYQGNKVNPAYYAHLVEFGTRRHLISPKSEKGSVGTLRVGQSFVKGAVQHPGSRPRPFLRPAWDRNRRRAMITMGNVLGRELTRVVK